MIVPQDIYDPLYTNKDKFIILVTGGRGSGKSFNVSTFIERLTFQTGHIILYTRYTMTSAHISVIPEFMEKIELDGTAAYFTATKTDIVNNVTKSSVLFRGIKTSSGNQTAKLKSIQGITTFVCDEAEEWVSENDFDKIMLSIRQKGIQSRVVIIMNPSDVNHFIYQKYIKNTHRTVSIDGVDVQISDHPIVSERIVLQNAHADKRHYRSIENFDAKNNIGKRRPSTDSGNSQRGNLDLSRQ